MRRNGIASCKDLDTLEQHLSTTKTQEYAPISRLGGRAILLNCARQIPLWAGPVELRSAAEEFLPHPMCML
jgi:hypothetical protein